MLEITSENKILTIKSSSENDVKINYDKNEIFIGDLSLNYPWEYEKSGILIQTMEYQGNLFYNLVIEKKHILVFFIDNFEIKEEILSFFWDIDILIIPWTKEAIKIFENIETRTVIPFWEAKNIFFQNLWQHPEEIEKFKAKVELESLDTNFVNLTEK